MEWWEADSRFRKMLVFIALRAQRPVCLKATIFLDICIETMSGFLITSYYTSSFAPFELCISKFGDWKNRVRVEIPFFKQAIEQ